MLPLRVFAAPVLTAIAFTASLVPQNARGALSPETGSYIFRRYTTDEYRAKPENWAIAQDRRGVIEEAAGITKFKTRKRLAEAKLEGAKQNLARVYDILEEVTRQVNSLKRQAAKAKRYGELKTELEGRLRVRLALDKAEHYRQAKLLRQPCKLLVQMR